MEEEGLLTLFFSNFQFSSWAKIWSTTAVASLPWRMYSRSWHRKAAHRGQPGPTLSSSHIPHLPEGPGPAIPSYSSTWHSDCLSWSTPCLTDRPGPHPALGCPFGQLGGSEQRKYLGRETFLPSDFFV